MLYALYLYVMNARGGLADISLLCTVSLLLSICPNIRLMFSFWFLLLLDIRLFQMM